MSVQCGKLGVTWKLEPKSVAGRFPDGGVTLSVMCPPPSCSFWQESYWEGSQLISEIQGRSSAPC